MYPREVGYWPGLNQGIDTMVQNCNTCIRFSNVKSKQPIQHHKVPSKPWQKVGTDIETYNGKDYLTIDMPRLGS